MIRESFDKRAGIYLYLVGYGLLVGQYTTCLFTALLIHFVCLDIRVCLWSAETWSLSWSNSGVFLLSMKKAIISSVVGLVRCVPTDRRG